MARPGQIIQIANAANRSSERTKSAGKCGQIYGGPIANPWRLWVTSMTPITN
jgi:hypothetical protein